MKIVHKVEEGMDRQEILATTYQMRNFYRQFKDGFFTDLDVMNYIQHHQIVKRWCKKGKRVLDVCCGRGLLLPLLRYYAKEIESYTGVDIEPRNAVFVEKKVTTGESVDIEEYYPFPVHFVHSNAAEMSQHFGRQFDVLVYTSSIEHMHKDMGQQSLHECKKLCSPNGVLILTCPNTPETQDGYDTQYKAHVYEWKRSELVLGLEKAGFVITEEWGLTIGKRDLVKEMEKTGLGPMIKVLEKSIPREWLCPLLAPLFPQAAKEIGFIARPAGESSSLNVQLSFI